MKSTLKGSGLILLMLSFFIIYSCKKDKPAPPTITTASATEISYTTAASGGNVTSEGGAPVTARGICWNTSADPTIANNIKAESGTQVFFKCNMDQLTPNTSYYVKAYATNSGGTGYGKQVTFTTSRIEVPVLNTIDITSITQTSAISGGNITDENGGSVIAKGVCWNTSENPTTSNSKTSDGTGAGSFISTLTELTGNTVYYLRSYATNSAGTHYGNQISFKTSPSAPALSTKTISSISLTSCNSGGNINDDGGASITLRGVCWSASHDPTTSDNKTDSGSETNIFASPITGLTAGTTYFVRAYAINSAGTGYGNELSFNTFALSDIDGNLYHAVTIGTQTWLGENLNTTRYNNGESIPNITDPTEWYNQVTGAYCNYDNDPSNSGIYGRLYNSYAISDPRGACPSGWHVPSDEEWTTFVDNLGGMDIAGGKIKELGTTHWTSANPDENNDFGFTALPGGFRYFTGTFNAIGDFAYWWSSTEYSSDFHWIRYISRYSGLLLYSFYQKNYGLTVRCVKD